MATDTGAWSWFFGKAYAVLSRNPASNRVVFDLAELAPDDRVLDVGCGAGKALALAAKRVGGSNVYGVDPTQALASTARKRIPDATIEVALAEQLPFDDDMFTVVWTIASPHHWEDRRAGLEEVARVLAPGGRFLLGERLVRSEGGHGLTEQEAIQTGTELEEVGLVDVDILRQPIKWYTIFVIRSRRPSA